MHWPFKEPCRSFRGLTSGVPRLRTDSMIMIMMIINIILIIIIIIIVISIIDVETVCKSSKSVSQPQKNHLNTTNRFYDKMVGEKMVWTKWYRQNHQLIKQSSFH